MNLYDKVCIQCIKCNGFIGEADFDVKIIRAICGKCANSKNKQAKIKLFGNNFRNRLSSVTSMQIDS